MAYEPFEIELEQDLSDVKEFSGEGFGPPEVPPGDYVLDVISAKQDTSKNNNTMVVVEFQVAEGDFAGKQLTGWYTITSRAIGRWKKLVMACGGRLDNKVRSEDVVGCKILARVDHEPGQQQKNPDGSLKCDANGVPYEPRIFAKVLNERPLEQPAAAAQPAAPPPVTRAKGNSTPAATRRA